MEQQTTQTRPQDLPARAALLGGLPTRYARPLIALVGSIALFLACFVLYSRYNNFPIYYHRDEPSKAEQILHNTRNFNHPQLMLEATEIATKWLGTPRRQQAVVMVGRDVSAVFAALAVVALAITAYQVAGLRGFTLTGVAAALCPALLVNAHTMKEETALVLGLCLTVLASKLFWDARRWLPRILSLVFLGVACAVALSGKYTGLYATIAALPLVLLARPLRWYTPTLRGVIFIATLILTVALINHRVFGNYKTFRASLQEETRVALHGHGGQNLPLPNAFHALSLVRQTPPHILVLGVAYLVLLCATPRRTGVAERRDGGKACEVEVLGCHGHALDDSTTTNAASAWPCPQRSDVQEAFPEHAHAGRSTPREDRGFLAAAVGMAPNAPEVLDTPRRTSGWEFFAALFALGYFVLLCWCAIDIYRYVLVVVLLLHFFAALAVVRLSDLFGHRYKLCMVLPAAFVALVMSIQLPHCMDFLGQFKSDCRTQLREWIGRNIPPGTAVAADSGVGLVGPGILQNVRIPKTWTVTELGELSGLAKQGFSYVAVDQDTYGRYFDPLWVWSPEFRTQYAWRRQWYEQLFRDHELAWSNPPRHPMYVDGSMTEVRLYRLRK